MSHASKPYEGLRQFLGGWFHQDFDIEGDSIEDIVEEYVSVSSPDDVGALKAEIDGFIAAHPGNLDAAFVEIFHPDIDPAGWGMSTREWLERVRQNL